MTKEITSSDLEGAIRQISWQVVDGKTVNRRDEIVLWDGSIIPYSDEIASKQIKKDY